MRIIQEAIQQWEKTGKPKREKIRKARGEINKLSPGDEFYCLNLIFGKDRKSASREEKFWPGKRIRLIVDDLNSHNVINSTTLRRFRRRIKKSGNLKEMRRMFKKHNYPNERLVLTVLLFAKETTLPKSLRKKLSPD